MDHSVFDDFAIIPIDIGVFNTFLFDMGDEEGGWTEGHEISSYVSSALWREGWDDDLGLPRPPKDAQFIAEGEAALFKILERGVRHFASVGAVIVPLGQKTADDGNVAPFMGLVVHKADADIALSLVHDRDETTGKHGGRIRIPPLGRFKGLVMAVYADWRQEPWPRSPIDMFAAARAAAAEDFVSPQMSLAAVGSDRLPFDNEEMTDWLARVCVPSDQLAALAKWWETCGKNFELFASHSMVIRRRSSQPIEWVVPGLIQRGEVTSLVGPSEAGKSTALADLVAKLSDRGKHEAEFLGIPVQPVDGLCVYISAEDMAAILGIPARGISLGGKLGLTIEKQASALGWFQPGTNMIGLPRRSNSFAHEWGHALDYHLLGTLSSTDGPVTGRGLSGAIRQMGENLADADGIPNRDIRDGFIHLLNTMFFDKAGLATRVLDLEAKIASTRSDKVRADLRRQIDNITAGNAKPRGLTSDFAKLSKAFGDKNANQEYWTSPTEMLARAFEAYVSYKAEAAGMSTEFIGKGDAAYLSDADERFAMTFPKGTERLRIFDAFDNIFAHIATQEALGAGAATMPDPAAKATRNPFEQPAMVAPRERNFFRAAIGNEFDAMWSQREARRKRLRDRPASDEASMLRHMHDALSYFKYGMTARLKMLGRRYDAPTVRKLHDMLTHTAGDKSTGRDYLRAIDLRTNQYQNRVSLLVGNYNAEINRSRSRELSITESDHLRDLLTSTETTAESKPMQILAAGLRKLSDDIFYDMQRAGIDVG